MGSWRRQVHGLTDSAPRRRPRTREGKNLCRCAARLHVIDQTDKRLQVAAVIAQNGNGYEVGFAEEFWKPVREYWREQTLQTAAAVRPDIRQTSRHLVVRSSVVHSGDRVVADTTAPLALYESGFAPRWYVPRADVDVSALTPVEGQSFCPYKGLVPTTTSAEPVAPPGPTRTPGPRFDASRGLCPSSRTRSTCTSTAHCCSLSPGRA